NGIKISFPTLNTDYIEISINNKRIAGYISEVFLYLYSKWNNETNNTNISQFIKDNTVIIPKFKYIVDSPMIKDIKILEENKLVCTSNTMIKKLIFVLRHELQYNSQSIKEYYKKQYLSEYYTSIYDFKKGKFILTTSFPSNNPITFINLETSVVPNKSDYYLVFNDTINKIKEIDSIDYTSNIYIYNSKDHIIHLDGNPPNIIVYKYNNIKKYLELNNL